MRVPPPSGPLAVRFALLVLFLLRPMLGSAEQGKPAAPSASVYSQTRHGDPRRGVMRIASDPTGDCAQCHGEHEGAYPYLLFAPNTNALCFVCHNIEGSAGIYPGSAAYNQSSHAVSGRTVWPGRTPAARRPADAGKCLNCHDPHGAADTAGLIPSLLVVREESLCLACHNGSQAVKDVRSQFLKPFRHPISVSGRHQESENSPESFAASPTNNRHSECEDCHNPHWARPDPYPVSAPNAPGDLLGASRVRVTNGPAGSRPIYTWKGPEETVTFPFEYELCFKCHSSWTTLPAGKEDLALSLNPANPSYHPVEAAGRNRNIRAEAFAEGWSADRLTYCSDCHGSDDPSIVGPHGSVYRYLLKKAYATTAFRQGMARTDLCFDCHAYAAYADPSADTRTAAASRFNPPASARGHAYHVGSLGLSCYACHQSHGSTRYPALLGAGRSPGLTGFTATASGGTCTSTCHGVRTYAVNYRR
jgi:predicted CXXCH cytochrome family protein